MDQELESHFEKLKLKHAREACREIAEEQKMMALLSTGEVPDRSAARSALMTSQNDRSLWIEDMKIAPMVEAFAELKAPGSTFLSH
jgi:hypothetical protein